MRRRHFKTNRASVHRWAVAHRLGPDTRYKKPAKPVRRWQASDFGALWQYDASPHAWLSGQLQKQALLDILAHANAHEIHRELRPPPACPWWRFVWSLRSSVRVGDDGKVPVRTLRLSVDVPPRSRLTRCLLPDGDIFFLKSPPQKIGLPLILLHPPVF